MSRTRILALLLAVAIGALAAACGGSDPEQATTAADGGTTAAPSGEPTKLTMSYSWPTVDFMAVPIVAAQELGYFAEAGVEVELIFPPDPASSAKVLATGDSDIGLITTTDMAFAVKQGLGITAIGNYTTSNNWGLFTKPDTPISLDTLKGKKISGYGDSWTKAMLPFVLDSAGLTEQDVEVVTVDWDLPLLLKGEVDVATNTTNFLIPGVLDETGKEPNYLLAKDNGAPDVPVWVYAVNDEFAAGNADAVSAFLRAVGEATVWASENPAEAVKMYEAAYPDNGSSTAYNTAGWEDTLKYARGADGSLFTMTDEQWTSLGDALKGIGELDEVAPPSDYYTNDYIAMN